MRPIKLIVQNFGPFIDESLDFSRLNEALFLISGPTGSGKTTLFDAICYALYHEASSPDRLAKGLKSDFVGDDALASVDFTFAVGAQTYRIHRIPEQRRKSQRGNRIVTQKHEVALYRLEAGEAHLMASAVEEVDAAIGEIIGLSYAQFRQIVLLPQGEFSRLLKASRNERQALLKSIFRLDIFESFAQRVEEHTGRVRMAFEQLEHDRIREEQALLAIPGSPLADAIAGQSHTLDALLLLVSAQDQADQAEAEALGEALEKQNGRLQGVLAQLGAGESLNARFKAWEAEKEKAGLLKAKSQEMATLRRQRERGRRALDIRPLEKRYQEEIHHHQQVKAELTQQEKAIQAQLQAQKSLEAQAAQVEDPAYKRETEEMEARARRLGELSKRLEAFEGVSSRHKEHQGAMEALQKSQEELAAKIREKALLEEALSGDRKALLKGQGEQVDIREEGTTLTTHIDGLAAIQEALEKMNASRVALKEMDRERLGVKQELKQWEQERDRIERIQQESAAGELAKHLQDGAPCPVCGAIHHPDPAIPLEALATSEDLKKAREACSRLSGRLAAMAEQNAFHTREKQAKREQIEGQLIALNREPQLPDPIALDQEIEALQKTRDQLRERYKDEEGRLKALRQDIRTKEEQLKGLETALSQGQSIEAAYEEAKTALNESNGILQSKWREIEDQARDLEITLLPGGGQGQIEDILQGGETLREGVQRRQRQAEGILKELAQSRETLGGLEGTRQSLEKQTEEARTQRDTREKAFIDALDTAGFTRIDYQAYHRLKSEDLDAMAETLSAYDQCGATNTALLKGFEEELAGKTPVDLQVLQGEKVAIEEDLGGLRESIGQITQRRRVNEVQVQRLERLEAERRQVRHQLEILTELGDTIKGKVSGKPKIKLENYILSAYLSDILEAANGFLEESSNGRYHLMIAGNHGDKSSHGLEIEVDDAYTGRARSAASLSGGETFVAALSMALGLSDIIQSTAGGISLETIFIDEGFATLDKDALDKAMNCLARIRTTGRTVGIISHVEELKERVDAQVIVEKTEAGSRLHLI